MTAPQMQLEDKERRDSLKHYKRSTDRRQYCHKRGEDQMIRPSQKDITLLLTLGGTVFLASCSAGVDPTAAQQFAKTAQDATSSFSSIAADFQSTCLRRRAAAEIAPSAFQGVSLQSQKAPQVVLAPGYEADTTPSPEPTPSLPPPPVGYTDDVKCRSGTAVSNDWARANSILLAYPQELGAIAAVDAVPTPNASPLGSALVSASLVNQSQVTAISSLVTDISSFIIANDQRQAIHDLVIAADPSVEITIPALEQIDEAYSNELWFEFGDTTAQYGNLIANEANALEAATTAADAAAANGDSPAAKAAAQTDVFLLENQIANQKSQESTLLEAINTRRTASIAYASVLKDLLKTHKALLASTMGAPTLKDYYTILNKSLPTIYSDVEALKKAVK